MRKLITILLAILMSLILTMTGTQPTESQTDTYRLEAVTESAYEPTVDIETEPIVTVIAEWESIATEPLVVPVDAPCDAIPTAPEAVPDTEETPAVSEQNTACGSDQAVEAIEAVETAVTDTPEATNPSVIETPEETSDSVPCVDHENNNLAPYTPADGLGAPNPFENAAPNEVTEIDAEDLIQPGDDKPGEGIHF